MHLQFQESRKRAGRGEFCDYNILSLKYILASNERPVDSVNRNSITYNEMLLEIPPLLNLCCYYYPDYSERRVVECINSELVNTLGNLLSRTTAPAVNTHQVVPPVDLGLFSQRASGEENDMLDRLRTLPGRV